MDAVKMLVIIFPMYFHSCFHTRVGMLSSPGAVVPFAALSAFWTSSSVIGSHGISSLRGVDVSSLGSVIWGKNVSLKILALLWLSETSSESTFSAGIFP